MDNAENIVELVLEACNATTADARAAAVQNFLQHVILTDCPTFKTVCEEHSLQPSPSFMPFKVDITIFKESIVNARDIQAMQAMADYQRSSEAYDSARALMAPFSSSSDSHCQARRGLQAITQLSVA